MINRPRILWIYRTFGLGMAIRSAAYDIVAVLAYMGYCLTLPFQFFWLLWRGRNKSILQIESRVKKNDIFIKKTCRF